MTITGGSGLPKDDIERMMKEAEEHAGRRQEACREEVVQSNNPAESSSTKREVPRGQRRQVARRGQVERLSHSASSEGT